MATIKTVPQLLVLLKKVQSLLEEQRDGAVKESKAFRHALSLKPKNPLTAVANAMIQSAKSRLRERGSNLGYIMVQHMGLKLAKLQLAIFYRQVLDPEMALFTGLDIMAKLDHYTDSGGFSFRNKLNLSLTSMSIARISALNHALTAKHEAETSSLASSRTAATWLIHLLRESSESIIFKLPAMNVIMTSQDISNPLEERPRLEYEFWSSFPPVQTGSHPGEIDTDISLNISLYKWLAEFRTRLAAELSLVSERSSSSAASPPLPTAIQTPSIQGGAHELNSSAAPQQVTRLRSSSNASTTDHVTSTNMFDYVARSRHITRPTIRQLGDATPDILHPFFSKQAGFNIEEELPAYIHEYSTVPLEQIMKALLRVYSRQFKYARPSEKQV
jgi:hypothetical protein